MFSAIFSAIFFFQLFLTNTKVNSFSDNLKVSATTQFSWNNTYFRYLIMRK